MKILVVLAFCAGALSLPTNQNVETPQDLLQKVLAANPLENDIGIGLQEMSNTLKKDQGIVHNPAQVVQMLQKVLQKEETLPLSLDTEQDLTTTEPDYERNSTPPGETLLDYSDNEVLKGGNEPPNKKDDKYTVTADVGIITFDPTIKVTEEKPKATVTEQDESQYTPDSTPLESDQPLSEGQNANTDISPDITTSEQIDSTSQAQDIVAVALESTIQSEDTPIVKDVPIEESPDITSTYPVKQLPSKYNPIIFPGAEMPKPKEKIMPSEGNEKPEEIFDQQSDVSQQSFPNTEDSQITTEVPVDSFVDETTDSYAQIPIEGTPIISPFDTLPLEPAINNTPLDENRQNPVVEEIPQDAVQDEETIQENPAQENYDPLTEAKIDKNPDLYADPVEGNRPIRPLEMVPPEELIESILAEEAPLLRPQDILPIEPINKDISTESDPQIENNEDYPVYWKSEPIEIRTPLDPDMVPLENAPGDMFEPLSTEPEVPQVFKEPLPPSVLDENAPLYPLPEDSQTLKESLTPPMLGEPIEEPYFLETNIEAEGNNPELTQSIQGDLDITPEGAVNPDTQRPEYNPTYPVPSMDETFEDRPVDPIFDENLDANQENTPYDPIPGMDENFVAGQFNPFSNVRPGGNRFPFEQYPSGLDVVSQSFSYNPYEQLPFISSSVDSHYNPHWGFPDIYEAPKYGRPSFSPGDRYTSNEYYDRDEYDQFAGPFGVEREYYEYNPQQRLPGLDAAPIPVGETAVNSNKGDTLQQENSFIPEEDRPLLTDNEDNSQPQFNVDPKHTMPSHKFVPMVGMPQINRPHPIPESMSPFKDTYDAGKPNLQLPIFNYKNQMYGPAERYNTRQNPFNQPQNHKQTLYIFIEPNIPQDRPYLQDETHSQKNPNMEQELKGTQQNQEKHTKTNNFEGIGLLPPFESGEGYDSRYLGEKSPQDLSPSPYIGSFEQQYYDQDYIPNIYPQQTKSGISKPDFLPGLPPANRNTYLNVDDTYAPYDRSPYYSGGMGYHKPHVNYRDEFYY